MGESFTNLNESIRVDALIPRRWLSCQNLKEEGERITGISGQRTSQAEEEPVVRPGGYTQRISRRD